MSMMLLANSLFPISDWYVAVWLFALGGVIGSFLNVVICRLPAGMSLVEPGSHCPICKHRIRWYDNIPMLSWILLRARCRDCGAGISARYPAVEAMTALLFVGLGAAELLCEGATLPLRSVPVSDGVIHPQPGTGLLVGIYAYHLVLLCTLLAIAAIECDGRRVPVRLVIPAMVVGLVGPLFWPGLRPVPVWSGLDGWLAGCCDGLAGLALGTALGLPLPAEMIPKQHTGKLFALSCVGLFLGYQAVIVLTAATLVLHSLAEAAGRTRRRLGGIPPTVWLCVTTVAWILAWRRIVEAWPLLG